MADKVILRNFVTIVRCFITDSPSPYCFVVCDDRADVRSHRDNTPNIMGEMIDIASR
jgi:hypothetical protein